MASVPDQGFVSSDPNAAGSKRRRIALACNACRTRKSRCDGQRPNCSACVQLSLYCQYDVPESATNVIVRKEYVSDLEQRLKQVEALLQRHDDLLTGHLSDCTPNSAAHRDVRQDENLSSRLSHLPEGPIQVDASGFEEPGRETDDETGTDGLAITFVDESASVYFGESSNIQFVRYLLRAMSEIWHISNPERPSRVDKDDYRDKLLLQVPGEYSPLGVENATVPGSSMSVVPAAAEIEGLMRVYFHSMGLLFPFLHEPTFWDEYRRFKSSKFLKVRRTWLGLLNMIMAMASNIDRSSGMAAAERMERSLSFYSRGVDLCSAPSVRTVSLDTVHYLLLQVLFLQGTPRSIQAWTIHGLLVRSATALGLHCDAAGHHLPPIEQEARRRTWHTIYCVDKVMSATFGRPSAVSEDQIGVPLPKPWPMSETGTATRRRRGANALTQETADFLAVSTQLYQVMGQSLARQYHGNVGGEAHLRDPDEFASVQAAGEMRQRLRQWVADLPGSFQLLDPNSPILLEKSLVNKLKTILTIRYHNVNILIHRPLLCATLRYLSTNKSLNEAKLPYATQIAMAEGEECISAARHTIDIVATILADNPGDENNLGVWFFTLYYVFTAALMVCARLLCAQHGGNQDAATEVEAGRSYLEKAADALSHLDGTNRLVSQCSRYIRYLSKLQGGQLSGDQGGIRQSDSVRHNGFNDGDLLTTEDVAPSTEFTELERMLDASGDLGSFLAVDLFDPSLLGGFMPPGNPI